MKFIFLSKTEGLKSFHAFDSPELDINLSEALMYQEAEARVPFYWSVKRSYGRLTVTAQLLNH